MASTDPHPIEQLDESAVLRTILEGTAGETGQEFFRALVSCLTRAIGTYGAWVTEYLPESRRLRALAFRLGDRFVERYEYAIAGTPCEPVVTNAKLVHVPQNVVDLYPRDPDLFPIGAVSFLGAPLLDADGSVLGHLAVIDTRPLPEEQRLVTIFRIFAARAAAELRRLRAEAGVRDRERRIELLRDELRELHGFDEVLGRSPAILAALADVRKVAPTDATVLLLGETGTGKGVLARAIHAASKRRDAPLVNVNCAAIPAALAESEFFGHEKGAFTGATSKREGRFALAHRGTIFLDEVGEIPPDLQAKLLRVLQDGEFEPVGGSATRQVDVRVIAATNRDLERDAREGRFRQDLFYRLSVFPIRVPSLRERGDDVALLAEAFAERFASRMGRSVAPLTPECRRRLAAYPWPGNVRELENVIERAVITAEGGRLDLARAIARTASDVASGLEADTATNDGASPDPGSRILTAKELQLFEKSNITRALEAADWRVSGANGAAKRLGVHPSTLASRMKALGIRKPRAR